MNLTDKSLDKKEGFKKTGYKTGQGKEKKKVQKFLYNIYSQILLH